MDSTRGIGGIVGAIFWIMISDVAGGVLGLVAGSRMMGLVEPALGVAAAGILLVSVPLGLCTGGLLGVTSLGWIAMSGFEGARRA